MKLRRTHLVFIIFLILSAGFLTAPGDKAYREYNLVAVSESDQNATQLSELPSDHQQLAEQLIEDGPAESTIYELNPYGITIEISKSESEWQIGEVKYHELLRYSPISHEGQVYSMWVGGYNTQMNPIPFFILTVASFSIGLFVLRKSDSESTGLDF